MGECKTCRYWKRDTYPTRYTGKCQRMLMNLEHGKMILQPAGWLDGIPDGYCEGSTFSVAESFGCVRWKEIDYPFHVERYSDPRRVNWSIIHTDSKTVVITLSKAVTDGEMVESICQTLNELWAGRDAR